VGRRSRARQQPKAPLSEYRDPEGNELALRAALKPASRREYARLRAGTLGGAAAREDDEQRAVEFLFERLAARWTIAGLAIDDQRELLGRLRLASGDERAWVRETLRRHCAEWFPDVNVP
jgi:hypothetical protein